MSTEHSLVRLVARISPWLAPLPNAYLVGRSAMVHLAVPLPVAVIIAAIIELLGIATVHTALALYAWNLQPAVQRDRGAWQRAPTPLAVAASAGYFVSVLFLSLVLETYPQAASWAPALFPAVAAVGALTLALISQHDARIARYAQNSAHNVPYRVRTGTAQHGAQQTAQPSPTRAPNQGTSQGAQHGTFAHINTARRANRTTALDELVTLYAADPHLGATEAGRRLGIHRNTVYLYLDQLQASGRIRRDNGTVHVMEDR